MKRKETYKEEENNKKIEKRVVDEAEKERIEKLLKDPRLAKAQKIRRTFYITMFIALFIGTLIFLTKRSFLYSLLTFIGVIILSAIYSYFSNSLKESDKIKKMEAIFPDFLQLMGSNLRAGITIDRAMLISTRKEFAPLDEEITRTGKDIATGKDIETALMDMSKRINSKKISRIILLIIAGIKSGGNISVLLENTAVSMREKEFVEKKASGNVMMYVIFIFIAIAVGAPALFALSTILVQTLSQLLAQMPEISTVGQASLPFTLTKISVSVKFIEYFSVIFIIAINLLGCFVLGLVSKGEEKEGLKFFIPVITLSLSIFFGIKYLLSGVMAGLFG